MAKLKKLKENDVVWSDEEQQLAIVNWADGILVETYMEYYWGMAVIRLFKPNELTKIGTLN